MLISTLFSAAFLATLATGSPFLPRIRSARGRHCQKAQAEKEERPPIVIEAVCPGCGFFVENEEPYQWIDDVESALQLNFTTQNNTVLLNDKIFYPIDFSSTEVFYAPLIRKSGNDSLPPKTVPIRLGYTLGSGPSEPIGGKDAVPLRFHVLSLADRHVEIDTLPVKVWRESDGSISALLVGPFDAGTPGSHDGAVHKGRHMNLLRYMRSLAGITASMTIILLALLAGRAVRSLWVLFVRGKRSGVSIAEAGVFEEAVKADEKDGLIAEEEVSE